MDYQVALRAFPHESPVAPDANARLHSFESMVRSSQDLLTKSPHLLHRCAYHCPRGTPPQLAAVALLHDEHSQRRQRWTGIEFVPRHMIDWVNRPLTNNEQAGTFLGHSASVYALAISGDTVASAGDPHDGKAMIYLWDLPSGSLKVRVEPHFYSGHMYVIIWVIGAFIWVCFGRNKSCNRFLFSF